MVFVPFNARMHQEQRQQHSFEDINFKGKNTPPSIHAIPDQVVVAHPPSDVVVAANTATAYFLDTLKRTDNECCQWQHPPTLEICPLLAQWGSCWVMGGDYIIMHYYVVAAVAISIAAILSLFLDKSYCDVIHIKHIMLQNRVKSRSLQNVANTEKHKLN